MQNSPIWNDQYLRRLSRKKIIRRRRIAALVSLLIIATSITLLELDPFSSNAAKIVSTTTSLPKATTTTAAQAANAIWRIAWGSAMAWGNGIASNTSVRELVTSPIEGTALKVRISNQFGNSPLVIKDANVAVSLNGATIDPNSIQSLTFNGSPSAVIPIGKFIYSDPITETVNSGETFAVSFYVASPDLVTIHPCCRQQPDVSFFNANNSPDVTTAQAAKSFQFASTFPRWVDALYVLQNPGVFPYGSIIALGDSITDGFNSTTNWVNKLQQRIGQLPVNERRAVINEGITANTLTNTDRNYSKIGGGPPGLERLEIDALSQPGVDEVIIFLGTNDIYFGATANQVISGLEQAINEVKGASMTAVGVTLTPRQTGYEPGAKVPELWYPNQQAQLQAVNQWILSSKMFSNVLDFSAVLSDTYNGACLPIQFFPQFNSRDNLHPNVYGAIQMANAVPASALGYNTLPALSQPINAVPTPNCPGIPGMPSAFDFYG